ncbi:MAG: J domain-containing protein [Clostridia bacterium]|nr:J domain-containing protein [Clostridia bacterium]
MDPYKVLGVSRNASDEEIRAAHRALAKKYHPDNYVNNPLADLAAEKMKEINAAYEQIQNERAGRQTNSGSYGGDYNDNGSSSKYAAVRNFIAYGDLDAAERLLNEQEDHDAEWYFLKGSVCFRRGWMDAAEDNFARATEMDPSNREYAAAYDRMSHRRTVYHERGGYDNEMSFCTCCNNLICADCCCECMGGDLIPCC